MTESRSLQLRLESKLDSIDAAELIINELARDIGHGQEEIESLGLAVREAMVNAVSHGNKFDEEKSVYFSVDVTPPRITITIRDEGEGFDPDAVPDPTAPENLLKTSGRGMLLIRAYVDDVMVRRAQPAGMEVVMVKQGPKGDKEE